MSKRARRIFFRHLPNWLRLSLLLSPALNAAAQSPVEAPQDVAAVQLTQMVQTTAAAYTLALQELGVVRLHPIKIKLSNYVSDYQSHTNGIVEFGDQKSRWPNGLAYLDDGTLMIKALPPYDQAELRQGVWHAMTHALQYDLSASNSIRAKPWLREGMADLFAFMAAGTTDADSIRRWKMTLHSRLTELGNKLGPADIADVEDIYWDELSSSSRGANFLVADLMLIQLYETHGPSLVPQLASYFRCLAQGLIPENKCYVDALKAAPVTLMQQVSIGNSK